jgi:hypothetical protein
MEGVPREVYDGFSLVFSSRISIFLCSSNFDFPARIKKGGGNRPTGPPSSSSRRCRRGSCGRSPRLIPKSVSCGKLERGLIVRLFAMVTSCMGSISSACLIIFHSPFCFSTPVLLLVPGSLGLPFSPHLPQEFSLRLVPPQ